ncbi:MAG: hypothetical protein HDT23_08065 [Ruminococcus sp.]|nr:hypothetical protein [Ruminococcus sp.]
MIKFKKIFFIVIVIFSLTSCGTYFPEELERATLSHFDGIQLTDDVKNFINKYY